MPREKFEREKKNLEKEEKKQKTKISKKPEKVKKEKSERQKTKNKTCVEQFFSSSLTKKPVATALGKSISQNALFFIVLFYCFHLLKQDTAYHSSYLKMLFTFVLSSIVGYFAHYISHHIRFSKNCNNIILRPICEFLDSHDTIHHNSDINKQLVNIAVEFCNNLMVQGVGIVILMNMIDQRVILLWAFMYATVHNINYMFVQPTTHKDHHLNPHTNYGIDWCDILFHTKSNWEDIESHNHGAINLLLITYIILFFS